MIIFMLDVNPYKLELLEGLGRDQVSLLLPILETVHFAKNSTIFKQDQEASFLYILTCGEVVVRYKPYDGEELTIANVYPEGVFGWSAALGRVRYTSSAYSITVTKTIRIRVERLQSYCERNPEMGIILLDKLASGIAERLRSTHDEVLALLSRGLVYPLEK